MTQLVMKQTVLVLTTLLLAVAVVAKGQTTEAAAVEEPSGEIGGIVVSSKTGGGLNSNFRVAASSFSKYSTCASSCSHLVENTANSSASVALFSVLIDPL